MKRMGYVRSHYLGGHSVYEVARMLIDATPNADINSNGNCDCYFSDDEGNSWNVHCYNGNIQIIVNIVGKKPIEVPCISGTKALFKTVDLLTWYAEGKLASETNGLS